jgi:hypothetical protein
MAACKRSSARPLVPTVNDLVIGNLPGLKRIEAGTGIKRCSVAVGVIDCVPDTVVWAAVFKTKDNKRMMGIYFLALM